MEIADLDRLLADPNRPQRKTLELLSTSWRAALEALTDDELLVCLRLIQRKINSKKLRSQRDALLGELRRDGLEGRAALPKAPAPAPDPAPEPDLVPGSSPTPSRSSAEVELERALARDPRDSSTRAVYRDWLEAEGLVEDGRVRLGPLADADDMLSELDWHGGFLRACRLSYSSARFNGERPQLRFEDALAALLDDPGPGRLVERLTLGLALHDDNDYSGACEVIGRRVRPALEELFIGDFGYEECELNWSRIADASPLWATGALPRLRKLTLRAGAMELRAIELPELRVLETVTGGMSDATLRAIAAARWPKLERLNLQIGLGHQGATDDVDALGPLLGGAGVPALVDLGLTNCEFTDELCERLADAALVPRLRRLDLSMGTMSLAGAEALLRRREAFAHLESIDVDDNYLPDEAAALLAQLGPAIHFGDQRDDDDDRRYASAYE